jgi:cell division protein FtsN
MALGHDDQQLELFDLSGQPVARLRHEALGRLVFQLRYDQLVLTCMALLMGLTVVFACGVERGKRLVRLEVESTTFARQPAAMPVEPPRTTPPATAPQAKPKSRIATAPTEVSTKETASTSAPREPLAAQAKKDTGRYAIQVVTYTRAQSAKREMDRLIARGERAFLVMRKGRTMVYVGPFPSSTHASEKLTTLKTRYQDCFVKIL